MKPWNISTTVKKKLLPFIFGKGIPLSRSTFVADITAALIVAVVLIPQSLGQAVLAGLPPQNGIFAAIFAVAVAALWGSSQYLSTGPDAVSSILTLSIVSAFATVGSTEYIVYAAVLAILVGLIRFLFGFFNQGKILYFIPHSVLVGFVTSASLLICATQTPALLGLKIPAQTVFLEVVSSIFHAIPQVSVIASFLGITALVLIFIIKKIIPKAPAGLIVLCLGAGLSYFFGLEQFGIPTIGSIGSDIPSVALPHITAAKVLTLLEGALVLAIVGFSEAFSIAEVLAAKEKQTIDINQELIGQGVGSITAGLFGGYPVSGSLSRTALNYSAGAKTYLSSVYVSGILVFLMMFAMPVVAYIPKTILAATIIAGVIGLIDIKAISHLFKLNRTDGLIALAVVTVASLSGLEKGLFIGVGLALLSFLRTVMNPRISELYYSTKWNGFYAVDAVSDKHKSDTDMIPIKGVYMVRVDMSLVYFNGKLIVERLIELLEEKQSGNEEIQKVVLDSASMNFADSSGVESFKYFSEYCTSHDLTLALYRPKAPVEHMLRYVAVAPVVLRTFADLCEYVSLPINLDVEENTPFHPSE